MSTSSIVKIGGASGMWGDSCIATPQLLAVPGLNYLSYDYLAETTMSILARAKAKNPQAGYATDFVTVAMAENLDAIAARGVKVLSNAGGLNPEACRDAVQTLAEARGLKLRIAVVTGDDIHAQVETLRAQDARDLAGKPLPERLVSANVYLGARAVAHALELGADIVISGRVVDSAFVVGALAHEFGWDWNEWDKLAQATLAGHIIECGAQGSGGLFTDWEQVPGWDDIGYPVIECSADGSFVVTKPGGTGGLVVPASVAEQVLYEIGDPAAYVMPDVVCDFRDVRVEAVGSERVRLTGARGRPGPERYKVSATYQDGYQLDCMMAIRGINAYTKAQKTADALLVRTRRLMRERGFEDYRDVVVEHLGTEALYGPHARMRDTREVVLRIAVRHAKKEALEYLRREVTSPGTSMGPGTRGHFGGRSDIRPVVRLCSFLVPRAAAKPRVLFEGKEAWVMEPASDERVALHELAFGRASMPAGESVEVPLVRIAHARSGDKGDTSNIGVLARSEALWPVLLAQLTPERVKAYFAHLVTGEVERYELPGLRALNFLLHGALGGGGMASLRSDPLGKSFAQMLLDMPIAVPKHLL